MPARSLLEGWNDLVERRYRPVSAAVVAALTAVAVPVSGVFVAGLGWKAGSTSAATTATIVLVLAVALRPFYESRPWEPVDRLKRIGFRVAAAVAALGAAGYVGVGLIPSPPTLASIGVLVAAGASVVLPALQGRDGVERAMVVGDDPEKIEAAVDDLGADVVGYLSPISVHEVLQQSSEATAPRPEIPAARSSTGGEPSDVRGQRGDADGEPAPDGGEQAPAGDGGRSTLTGDRAESTLGVPRRGCLSQLEEQVIERDVDTVALAFREADRESSFGALRICRDLGVDVRAPASHADSVLRSDDAEGSFVDVELEPWRPRDYVCKRAVDVVFSVVGLLVLAPVIALIALAIKVEGEGPVFFDQKRTYLYGKTFTFRKFRTLKPVEGGEVGTVVEEDRLTPLGQFLRTTHLDEIPQLWFILVGDMSVVGPRPAQTELEPEFEGEAVRWRQRWFVKPGLTGLAQINDATSIDPAEKLRYDLQYIRNQSFLYDLKIVGLQFWKVFEDAVGLFRD